MNPPLHSNTWNNIKALGTSESNTYSQGDYQIYANHLEEYSGQYYVMVFILKDEIFEVIEGIQDENTERAELTTIVLGIICVAVIIFIAIIVWLLLKSILNTFKSIEINISKLLRNVGDNTKSLGDGMTPVYEASSTELLHLQNNINSMILNLQQQREDSDQNNSHTVSSSAQGVIQMQDLWELAPEASMTDDASAPPLIEAFIVPDVEAVMVD